MGFLTGLQVDTESSEAFKEARKGYLLGSTMSKPKKCDIDLIGQAKLTVFLP